MPQPDGNGGQQEQGTNDDTALGDETLGESSERACTCPGEGLFAVQEGGHRVGCPSIRDWSLSGRLRYWLGARIPRGGVTRYGGDDTQRALTPWEHYEGARERHSESRFAVGQQPPRPLLHPHPTASEQRRGKNLLV